MEEGSKGMFCCGKARCKVCKFVETGSIFMGNVEKRSFHINHSFDCDSQGVVYLITCKRCCKQYVGSTITPFRLRFNNHKSSLRRYERGQRGICGEHLYAHFLEDEHIGLEDLSVKIIDVADVRDPTAREGFWIEKLKCYAPLGQNVIEV